MALGTSGTMWEFGSTIEESRSEFIVGSVANANPTPTIDANTTDVSIVLVFMAHLLFSKLPLLTD